MGIGLNDESQQATLDIRELKFDVKFVHFWLFFKYRNAQNEDSKKQQSLKWYVTVECSRSPV